MPSSTPNVLFLMTDQHRTDTLSCYGNQVVSTPALDRIAASGTCFDRMYTPTAICTPARASLLTGLHPFRHGLLVNPERGGQGPVELPDGIPNWGEQLSAAGLNVGHAGKWHVGRHRGPSHYGIEGEHMPGALNPFHHEAYRAWLEARGYPPFRAADGIFTEAHNRSGRGHLLAGRLEQPFEATIESYITEQALGLLDRYARDFNASGKPFMLTASFFGPHLPYLIPDAWFDLYDPADVTLPASFAESFAGKPDVQRRYSEYWGVDGLDDDTWRKLIAVYWGYVSMIDRCVGRLLDALDAHGLWSSTNIVFVADHGEFTGAHRLNDKGPAMYEDIYRVPAFIRVPGLPAQRCDAFASLVDLAPTFLEMAGVPVSQQGDGRSLMPLLRGESPVDWRSEIVAEFHGHHFSYAQRMIRDRRHKLVFNPESINELYDLAEDPHELRNVHDVPGYRGVRDDLTERLYRELVARGDPAFTWMTYMAPIGSARVGDIDGVADHVDRHG